MWIACVISTPLDPVDASFQTQQYSLIFTPNPPPTSIITRLKRPDIISLDSPLQTISSTTITTKADFDGRLEEKKSASALELALLPELAQ